MKDAVIAKLSSQCEELYGEVAKLFQKELLRALWDKDWIPTVSVYICRGITVLCTECWCL
jgi:programmed cell death 6-interacting protein